jgi:roadblock/LC7 domain-containing protein
MKQQKNEGKKKLKKLRYFNSQIWLNCLFTDDGHLISYYHKIEKEKRL